MNEVRTGRSLAKPRKVARRKSVAASYAALHRGRACEFREDGYSCVGEELHHVLGGARREHADWNMVFICRFHHRDGVMGFHGAAPLWDHRRAFELKLAQGYQLPPEAWGYLPAGLDACPTPEPDQEFNRAVTLHRLKEGT